MVEFFCRNSQCVKLVGSFSRRAPSLMFDGVLNATLSEEKVSTIAVKQENLKLRLRLNFLDSHQTKNNKMKSCTDLTSSFLLKRTHPLSS